MSQNPLVNSGAVSQTTGLKPPLAAALTSLEVHLDQELARYRRTRTGYKTFSQPRIGISTSSKPQQLTIINKTGGNTQLPVKEIIQKFGLTTQTSTPNSVEVPKEAAISTPKSVAETPEQVSASAADTLLQPQTLHSSTSSLTQNLQPFAAAQTPSASNTSIVPTGIKEQTHTKSENLADSDDHTSKQPDDYLESSEALLRSLAEEPKTPKPTNSNDSLLSPLGIGSMLLLLLASLTLGYVAFNPRSLPQLSLNGLFKLNEPITAENTADGNNVKTVAQPDITPIPKYPNLAIDEFPEVKDPNDVVSLKPKSKPTPTALSNPVSAQNPINPVPIPNVQPPTGLTAPPPTAKTPQKPANTQQKPDKEIKPSADGFYHVITDNQSDRSLISARQLVPDAYLSSDGKLIYLGALKTKEKAQKLVQQLQAQGIKAKIE